MSRSRESLSSNPPMQRSGRAKFLLSLPFGWFLVPFVSRSPDRETCLTEGLQESWETCRPTHGWFLVVFVAIGLAWLARSAGAENVPHAVLQAEQQRISAIAKATKTAVSVFANQGQGGGSGVVITPDGYALSNFHVTKPAGDHMKCGMADGQLYDAVIVGLDPTGDVAVIKLLGRDDFPCAVLADSDQVRAGDWCFAVGNPFLLATDFQPTVTYGLVSGVHRYQYPAGTLLEYADCIQTDASINPGNSGGPLFNADGDLIGIVGRGSFEKRGRVNVGVGYAISVNQIKNFLGYLRSGRIVDHATLGAIVSRDEDGRVIVTNILGASDAYRRGLRYGDEIVAFGDREITTVNGFKNVLGIFPKGWRVPLSYRREGQRHDVHVRLMGVHSHDELLRKASGSPQLHPQPKPKPKSKPRAKERKPGESPEPRQIPVAHVPKKPPIPKHVQSLLKKRTGYANYYFNELNRDRVWNAFAAHGEFSDRTAPWKLEGVLEDNSRVQIVLGEKEVTGRFPGQYTRVELEKDLDTQLGPCGSGGLLVALHMWRRLLILGPKKYGEVYYLGTAPVVGQLSLCDVLVATHGVVETRFSFDSTSGQLTGVEMFPDQDVDPCEIYLGDYRTVDGRQLPHVMQVHYGDEIFARITLESIELSAGSDK